MAERSSLGRLSLATVATVCGCGLIAICSWISVPMVPVPMTLQTFAVVVLGAILGPLAGVSATVAYLLAGAFGQPVFANGASGLAPLTGPTAGYLLAFPFAAALTGALIERRAGGSWLRIVLAMLLAHALILASGFAWLSTVVGASKAAAVGLTPFIPGALAKSALATAVVVAWFRWKPISGRQ